MLIVYTSGEEVFVCKRKEEKEFLKAYFTEGGRNTDDFDRLEIEGAVEIINHMGVSGTHIVN
jgi:hypothetical protein